MDKNLLICMLSDSSGVAKEDCRKVLRALPGIVVREVVNGGYVRLHGIGTFKRRLSKMRLGRNPSTQEKIVIPARYRPVFLAVPAFKLAAQSAFEAEAASKKRRGRPPVRKE